MSARKVFSVEWGGDGPPPPRPAKTMLTIRVDQDVLAWFKERGEGYQTHMNAVLRAYMEHEQAKAGAAP